MIPSFTGSSTATAPVHTMRQTAGGYSLTLTDANGVLEHYPFASQAGVTLTQSGNTLTAEAASGASWQELTFTASRKTPQPDSASCFFRLFYLDENNQTLASPPGQGQYTHGTGSGLFQNRGGRTARHGGHSKNRGQRKRGGLLL